MRLTIRQKIMAIAVGLIITMALAAVLSTSLTMKVVDRLQDLKTAYVPAYSSWRAWTSGRWSAPSPCAA